MHALGYLWDAAELFHPSGAQGPGTESVKQQRLVFVKQQAERLLNGQVQTVIGRLRAQSPTECGTTRVAREVIGYLSTMSHGCSMTTTCKRAIPSLRG